MKNDLAQIEDAARSTLLVVFAVVVVLALMVTR